MTALLEVESACFQCVHCDADVETPGVVYDGDEFVCEECGGSNFISCDSENPPYFQSCDDLACSACAFAEGVTA